MGSLSSDSTITLTRAGELPMTVESPFVSTNISMYNQECDSSIPPGRGRRDEIEIATLDNEYAPPFLTSNPRPVQFHKYKGILHLLYAGAIVVMYPSLAQLVQLKFQGISPFKTHGCLMYTSVVAYTIAIPTSILSFYMRARLESSTLTYYFYKILISVFCLSSILAPLSLVLVVLIPHGFNWIGYLIISALFVIIVAYNFDDYIKLLIRKMNPTWENSKETRNHHIP